MCTYTLLIFVLFPALCTLGILVLFFVIIDVFLFTCPLDLQFPKLDLLDDKAHSRSLHLIYGEWPSDFYPASIEKAYNDFFFSNSAEATRVTEGWITEGEGACCRRGQGEWGKHEENIVMEVRWADKEASTWLLHNTIDQSKINRQQPGRAKTIPSQLSAKHIVLPADRRLSIVSEREDVAMNAFVFICFYHLNIFVYLMLYLFSKNNVY